MENKRIKIVNVFGVPIARLTIQKIPKVLIPLIKSPGKKVFLYVNAHCLNLASENSEYKKILNEATVVYSGGFGPVLASKIINPRNSLIERTTTPNFIDKIFTQAEKESWKIYFLGGTAEVVEKAVQKVKEKHPKIKIVGYHNGYFTKQEEKKIIQELTTKKPKIIFVGMGTPKQEKWIWKNKEKVNVKVFWAVGAMFDMISGAVPRAPRFMQDLGLEWIFRFSQEPSRLWRRYTIGHFKFVKGIVEYRKERS